MGGKCSHGWACGEWAPLMGSVDGSSLFRSVGFVLAFEVEV